MNREIFIEDFLTCLFPKKFVIGTGEVIDSKGRISEQADVIVYDEFMPVFDYGATKHFLSSGVFAHVEVKSILNKQSLEKSLNITKTIKTLERDLEEDVSMVHGELPKKISSFIFSYGGMSAESCKKHFENFYKNEIEIDNKIDAICVLNEYIIYKELDRVTGIVEFRFKKSKGDTLMLFFNEVFYALQKNWAGIPDVSKYFGEATFPDF